MNKVRLYCARIASSATSQKRYTSFENAFCGKIIRDDLPKMLTQLPKKDLPNSNNQNAAESLDLAAFAVCVERRKHRIGIRLSSTERQEALFAAKQKGLNLSEYVRMCVLAKQNNQAA